MDEIVDAAADTSVDNAKALDTQVDAKPADKTVDTTITEGETNAITPAERTKYGIPDKFKDWAAVAKWGAEAEKAKSRAESEKGELERKSREMEEMLLESQSDKKDSSGMSTEEKSELAMKFKEDFDADPIGTMRKLFEDFGNRLESKQTQSAQVKRWESEEAEISKDYKDTWASEVKPALIKIAKERPHLSSLEELVAVYERSKAKGEKFNKDDSDEKKAAKKAALSESGHGTSAISEDLMKKIASANSSEELDRLSARLNK